MISFKKTWLAIILCLLTVIPLVLSGCPSTKPNGSTNTATTAATAEATATGTLNLYGTDPYTLDPATSSEATSGEYILQIFSGLLMLDDNLKPVADITKSWAISTDGTVYTFTLRNDVKFHDGRAVTATDFKYSWERACNPSTGSVTAGTYLGDIVGAKDMLAGKATSLGGVKVVDNYTLQVTIDKPKSYFLYKMAFVATFVVDKNNITTGEWWRKPNGTGPFKLKSWTKNQSLILERNDSYYGDKARVASVNYQMLSGVPMRLYETGSIDVTGIGSDYIDMVTDDAGPYLAQLSVLPELSFSYIGFNCAKPPFDDVNIRRAFSMAIDKSKLTSLVYRDMVQPAAGILPKGLPGYSDQLQGLDFNVTEAKALIAASKYGSVANLPPITITTTGWGGATSGDLQAIVYEWKQNLGVDVTIRQLEPERFFYNLQTELDEMYYTGWVADYPHPQNFLEVLFRSDSQYNYGRYDNAEADALLDKAGLETDPAKSLAIYQQVEQIMVDEAACLPLWFGKSYLLIKPYVKGYLPTAMGWTKLNKVSVNK